MIVPAIITAMLVMCLWVPVAAQAENLIGNGSFETVSPTVTTDTYTKTFGTLNQTNGMALWIFATSGANLGCNGIAT